jgi:hypothetical protein
MARLVLCGDCNSTFCASGVCPDCIKRHHGQREMDYVIAANDAERSAKANAKRAEWKAKNPEAYQKQRQQTDDNRRKTRGVTRTDPYGRVMNPDGAPRPPGGRRGPYGQ